MKRITVIILDSAGCGASPDAHEYGDAGSNTLAHVASAVPDMTLPNLAALGLGRIPGVTGLEKAPRPAACYGRMQEQSPGKDTTTGHWELAGLILDQPFPVYPDGFPDAIVRQLEHAFGRPVIGNIAASGTEIINRLGDEHVNTGNPIGYTSADSVLQIAAHEACIPVDRLYAFCRKARDIMQGAHAVGRIIARPFIGANGDYQRTASRKDFSLEPFTPTVLDRAAAAGYDVVGIGKIHDIYAGRGLTAYEKTKGNADGVNKTREWLGRPFNGLMLVNLVDFDMLYGHRNDPEGYAGALMAFDQELPSILQFIGPDDLLLITADHGCDPTFPGTDHTREYVPLLAYTPALRQAVDLGTRSTFADLAATVAAFLQLPGHTAGTSFLDQLYG